MVLEYVVYLRVFDHFSLEFSIGFLRDLVLGGKSGGKGGVIG